MALRTLDKLNFKQRRVLLRADLNVPLEGGQVADDQRIQAVLPTVRAILDQKPRLLVLCSHLGEPKGRDPEFSLAPVARHMSNVLGRKIEFLGGPTGVDAAVAALPEGGVGVLENLRYDSGEKKADPAFADKLAAPFDCVVLDAFGALHRPHASISLLPAKLPSVAGLLVQREVEALGGALENPERPLFAILGGAKVSSKLAVLKNLVQKVDGIIIGGAMAYTFLLAKGEPVGKSLVEPALVADAKAILADAAARGVTFVLPRDHVVASGLDAPEGRIVDAIGEQDMGLDIGPKTRQDIFFNLQRAKTIIWNGPVGAFEHEAFSLGTKVLTTALQNVEAKVIVGGGDTAAAVAKFGDLSAFDLVSTGGGASLEFLEGKTLPGVAALQEAAS